MKKRVLALLMAAAMVITFVPMTAFGTEDTYDITNGTPESKAEDNHGYITIDKETAAEGDTVTVTVKPADGYQLKSLTGTVVSSFTVDPSGTTAPNVNAAGFGGSTVRNGDFLGHNFDYYINDKKEVVIKTEADPTSRPHAVIGVANPYSLDVTGTAYDAETLKQLAWLITDGINDAGLVCSIGGVSTADIRSNPHSHTNDGAQKVMVLHLVRAILDNCGSVGEAKTFIENHDITALSDGWDAHIMIADENSTVIVEFTGEGVKFVEQEQWIMTDFYNHLFKEEDFLRNRSMNNFPHHTIGLERYFILSDSYATAGTKDGMAELLEAVTYTKTYDTSVSPFWCSEFYRTDMIPTFDDHEMSYWTKEKVLAQDAPKNLLEKYVAYEADGTYDPTDGLKRTAHSSIYNIKDKTLTVSFDDGREFIYTFDDIANPKVNFALQTDGTYQFKMPGYAVTITAEFEKCSSHVDADNNHKCDICGKEISDHVDTDPKDHKCDACGEEISDHADSAPKDHICDICGDTLSECADKNKDHKCDYCGKQISEHNAILVEGVAATLQSAGYKSYYKCDICGKLFEDETCKVEITDLDAWKAQGGNGYIEKLKEEPKTPQTGDTSNMALWLTLMSLSSMGACTCFILNKKKKNEQ